MLHIYLGLFFPGFQHGAAPQATEACNYMRRNNKTKANEERGASEGFTNREDAETCTVRLLVGGEARDESDGCPSVKYVQIPPSSSLLAKQCE